MTSSREARVGVQDNMHQDMQAWGMRGAVLLLPIVPILVLGLLPLVPWLPGSLAPYTSYLSLMPVLLVFFTVSIAFHEV